MGNFFPGETLPYRETDCYRRVEVPAGGGGAGDDGKGNADAKGPANLEEGAVSCDADGLGRVEEQGGGRCYAREAGQWHVCEWRKFGGRWGKEGTDVHIKEDSGGFGHAFSEETRAHMLKVQFSLGYGFGCNDVPGHVPLYRLCGTKLQVMGL